MNLSSSYDILLSTFYSVILLFYSTFLLTLSFPFFNLFSLWYPLELYHKRRHFSSLFCLFCFRYYISCLNSFSMSLFLSYSFFNLTFSTYTSLSFSPGYISINRTDFFCFINLLYCKSLHKTVSIYRLNF